MTTTAISLDSTVEATLREAVEMVPGWTPFEQLLGLFTLAYGAAARGDLLEIGSWCGRSMVALGLAVRQAGCGHVHCVEPFPERDDWIENEDGSFSMASWIRVARGARQITARVWREPFERDILPIYQQWGSPWHAFMTFRDHFGMNDIVTPHRMTAKAFFRAHAEGHRYGLAFVDGEHGYDEVCQNIDEACARLASGGFLCLDDAFTGYDDITAAIQECLSDPRHGLTKPMRLTRKMFTAVKA
jgi:predicted O-methyltransferase YrrM